MKRGKKLRDVAFVVWTFFWATVSVGGFATIIGWHMVRNGGPDSLITRVT